MNLLYIVLYLLLQQFVIYFTLSYKFYIQWFNASFTFSQSNETSFAEDPRQILPILYLNATHLSFSEVCAFRKF